MRRVPVGDLPAGLHALQKQCLPHDAACVPLESDVWFLAYLGRDLVGFSVVRPLTREPGVWYLARAGVLPSARGCGLQVRMIRARVRAAKSAGAKCVISDCTNSNPASARSLMRAGFKPYWPQHRWAMRHSIYWKIKCT